jgi:hypothetical protein
MVARVQIAFQMDTAFPRDAITINPHYNTASPQALVDQLKTNIIAHAQNGALNWFTIKAYDAHQPPPSYPVAEADNVVAPHVTASPREVALCLSYYAQFNRPGFRGRLFLPGFLIAGAQALRPSAAQQQAVIDFAHLVINNALPSGTFWTCYSPTHKTDAQVTNVWCDDEWDTVRSRGMRPTTRISAAA